MRIIISRHLGITDQDRILTNVRQANGARVSVHVVSLGGDVAMSFVQMLAQQNRGLHRHVHRVHDIQAQVSVIEKELTEWTELTEKANIQHNKSAL